MKQMTLDEARVSRDAGIKRVDDNASSAWIAAASAFLLAYCRTHETVFCDDLWRAGLEPPHEARALGPVMQRAVRKKIIERSGEYRASVHSNMTPKPVWRSLVWEGRRAS